MVRFITDKPVAFIPKLKALVATDLHLGIEHELYLHGIYIPPQAETFSKLLKEIAEDLDAKTLILLGDVKHEVPSTSLREMKEVPKFFESIGEVFEEIHIVKGNHDANLEKIVPKSVKLHGSKGFKIREFGFFHGHAWPSKALIQCRWLFAGHLQPAIELRDLFGYKLIERVWLKGEINKEILKKKYKLKRAKKINLVVFPSFNRLAGFFVINKEEEDERGSIIFKLVEKNKFSVYLLDGTYLGRLASLKPGS